MTRRCRRITLHLSQIGLTLGFTFTAVRSFWVLRRLAQALVSGLVGGRTRGYLYRYTMRPRDRSYGDSSTTTRSSGRMRM
jgi:hypothetical protein